MSDNYRKCVSNVKLKPAGGASLGVIFKLNCYMMQAKPLWFGQPQKDWSLAPIQSIVFSVFEGESSLISNATSFSFKTSVTWIWLKFCVLWRTGPHLPTCRRAHFKDIQNCTTARLYTADLALGLRPLPCMLARGVALAFCLQTYLISTESRSFRGHLNIPQLKPAGRYCQRTGLQQWNSLLFRFWKLFFNTGLACAFKFNLGIACRVTLL